MLNQDETHRENEFQRRKQDEDRQIMLRLVDVAHVGRTEPAGPYASFLGFAREDDDNNENSTAGGTGSDTIEEEDSNPSAAK